MFFVYKIINTIDGILEKIPKDIALAIKRLSSFLMFIFAIIALYAGYRIGISHSQIPGTPMIKETNDAIRIRMQTSDRKQELHLVDTPPQIMDSKQKDFNRTEEIVNQHRLSPNNLKPLEGGERYDSRAMPLSDLRLNPIDRDMGVSRQAEHTVDIARKPLPLDESHLLTQPVKGDKRSNDKDGKKNPGIDQVKIKDSQNKASSDKSIGELNKKMDSLPYKPLDLDFLMPRQKHHIKGEHKTKKNVLIKSEQKTKKNPVKTEELGKPIPLGDDLLR